MGFADDMLLASQARQAGRLDDAEAICRKLLAADATQAAAWNFLGMVCCQRRQHAEAVEHLRRATELRPDEPSFHTNLGELLRSGAKLVEAELSYRRALASQPHNLVALNGLGMVLSLAGQSAAGLDCFDRALRLRPEAAETHYHRGVALLALERLDEAIAAFGETLRHAPASVGVYNELGKAWFLAQDFGRAIAAFRQAVTLDPGSPEAHNNLGIAYKKQGAFDQALACYRQALAHRPEYVEALSNEANVFRELGRLDDAEAACLEAVRIKPDDANTHFGLAVVLAEQNRLEQARLEYLEALRLCPGLASARNNLGNLLMKLGRTDLAQEHFAAAAELEPAHIGYASNVLLCQQYLPEVTLARLADTHAAWARTHAVPLYRLRPVRARDRDPGRRLRLGFVSPDFYFHPVGNFLQPLLAHLDPAACEALLYSTDCRRDLQTDRLQQAASQWRQVDALSDEKLAELIDRDEIDLLFDLSGHTARHRLLVFARQPAPVQASWIGYAGTTGLAAIDYLVSDPRQIPPASERFYAERVVRLPDAWVCFEPPIAAPPVGPLPAEREGTITFGSFNFLGKMTPKVVEVWAEILRSVPGSRLVLLVRDAQNEPTRTQIRERFAAWGVDRSRVELLNSLPHAALLQQYNNLDLALDPFPYSGGLTTCEALWMGVPVITAAGETFASRHAYSLLSTVGLQDTIASDLRQYVQIAIQLANDLPRLAAMRAGLRSAMALSPLCDAPRFARGFEAACRRMWQTWVG